MDPASGDQHGEKTGELRKMEARTAIVSGEFAIGSPRWLTAVAVDPFAIFGAVRLSGIDPQCVGSAADHKAEDNAHDHAYSYASHWQQCSTELDL